MNPKTRFLISLITKENDYQSEEAAEAERTAQQLGIELTVQFADGDAITQSQQLLQEVYQPSGKRPDAIIVQPVGTSLSQVARAAASTGIGWAVLNRDLEYLMELRQKGAPVIEVTSDHVEIGRIQGRQIAALLPNGGMMLYIEGPSASPTARQRKQGMLETKPDNVQIRSIRSQWGKHFAVDAVLAWLRLSTSQHLNIDIVAAQADTLAMGAREALTGQANGGTPDRWASIPYLGCDGCKKTGRAWTDQRLLAATVQMPILSGIAIRLLQKALRGEKVEARTQIMPEPYPALEKLRPACDFVG